MDSNGQVVTLPGIIATKTIDGKKIYIPLDNIDVVVETDPGSKISFKRPVEGMDSVSVKEKISTLFSPEEAAKFAVEFAGAFMRGVSDKIATMRKLQGG